MHLTTKGKVTVALIIIAIIAIIVIGYCLWTKPQLLNVQDNYGVDVVYNFVYQNIQFSLLI